MKVLVTGATGFAGSHLMEYIKNQQREAVVGTRRRRSDLSNIEGYFNLFDCELTDYLSVRNLIQRLQPDRIFHLAAQSYVPQSWDSPYQTFEANLTATLNILEVIRKVNPQIRLLVTGSSEEYGLVYPEECPINELNPLRPMSPYAVSKVAVDMLCQQYVRSHNLHVVITRAFNHSGPRRGKEFATSSFAKQIAEIELGIREPFIQVGNIDAERDWTDVRDTVRGYWQALEDCTPGEPYNICRGKAWSVKEMLDMLLHHSTPKVKLFVDPDRLRPSDVPLLLGTRAKMEDKTGWRPEIEFEQTLLDLLNYWRKRVGKEVNSDLSK